MANYNKKISDTSVRIGEVRFAYTHVFAPRIDEEEAKRAAAENREAKGKYQVCVLIPKSQTDTIKMLQEAIAAAEQQGKNTKWGGKIPAGRKLPLHDGDEEEGKGEEFEGMMYINCSSGTKPGVRVLVDGQIVEALDDEDFYSGCWGAITVNAYPYAHTSGGKGVSFGLNNIIKTKDDERLAGRTSAESDFADLADDI